MDNDKKSAQRSLHNQAGQYLVLAVRKHRAQNELFLAESEFKSLERAMAETYYSAGYNGQLVAVNQLTIECDCEGNPTIRFIEDCVVNGDDWDKENDPILDQKLRKMVNDYHKGKEQKDDGNS
jgi:hypothetical protein